MSADLDLDALERSQSQTLIRRSALYQLDPTPTQSAWLARVSGACRFLYNAALEQRREWHRHANFSWGQQSRELTLARAEFDWLAACPCEALNQALRDLDVAYQRFFAGLSAYPSMRRKTDGHGFRLKDHKWLRLKRLSRRIGAVKLAKIGWIKVRNWRPLGGDIRNVTVSQRGGKWFASIQWQKEVATPAPSTLPPVGIDRGIKVFAALSDGQKIAPINSFRGIETKLARLQRRLARKTKFSANWRKLKAKISRLHMQAANARKDYLHKVSTDIAKSHGVVKVEKLNVRGMSASAAGTVDQPRRNVRQKSGLNKSILDQGWGMFRTMLAYKLAERGGQLVEVPAAYTSQTCAECSVVDSASRVDQATFRCTGCGHEANADVNAARNILQARAIAVEPLKRTLKRVGKRNLLKEAINVAA